MWGRKIENRVKGLVFVSLYDVITVHEVVFRRFQPKKATHKKKTSYIQTQKNVTMFMHMGGIVNQQQLLLCTINDADA